MQTYLKNGYIVSMDQQDTVFDGGGVLVEDDRITAVGKVDPRLVKPDAEVIDLQGKYVLPGFVNTHVHTSQQISRGVGDDVDFICWLHDRMWPFESSMTEEDSYVSTLMTSLELIRSGVTSFAEPGGQFVSGMARGTAESGLRGKLAKSVMDCGEGLPEIWQRTMEQELEQHRKEAEEELQLNGQPMDLSEKQRETYAAMPEEARQRLRGFMEKYRGTAERNPKLYGDFIHSVFTRAIMEQQMLMENAGVGGQEMDPEIGILYRDISQFKDTEIPKAIELIQAVAREINGELAAKGHSGGHMGKLDFRRTIRKGLETGGSFYRLRYRKKRAKRKRLVLLCDVSGSMVQFSEFALRFIQSLNQVSESSRVFLFSETAVEADAFRLQNMDLFRSYVKDSGIYGRGTDLGEALETLCAMHPSVLGASATLLILSDTKTIDQPRAVAAVREAKRQAGRVIFLNPIPEGKWQYIRSVQTMASICPMVSCSTLRELASACRRLTKEM